MTRLEWSLMTVIFVAAIADAAWQHRAALLTGVETVRGWLL